MKDVEKIVDILDDIAVKTGTSFDHVVEVAKQEKIFCVNHQEVWK